MHIKAFAPLLVLAPCVMGFSYHDNTVTISRHTNDFVVTDMYYVVQDHSVTGGQDPQGHVYNGMQVGGWDDPNQRGSMTFSVGRKGSSDVAKWWSDRVGPLGSTFGHNPDSLNFAFSGTLTLSMIVDGNADTWTLNAYLGQGSSGSSNNWWFGGPNCSKINNVDQASCLATDTAGHHWRITFSRGSDGGNDVSTVGIEGIADAGY